MSKLLSLFDDKLKNPSDLVASTPQTLETISTDVEEQEYTLRKLKQLETVKPKIDYSDFANFVFFNSALDYFNITGEKIINEFPLDGNQNAIETFRDDLDGYQNYVLDRWPKNTGHLKFSPSVSSSYIEIKDLGAENGRTRTGRLDANTGSMTYEFWCVPPPLLTGSDDVMYVFSKGCNSQYPGFAAGFSGSQLLFVISGSTTVPGENTRRVSSPFRPGIPSYFSMVFERISDNSSSLRIYSGSATEFPVLVQSQNVVTAAAGTSGSSFFIGSGSIPTLRTIPLSGSVDELRVWNTVRTLSDMSSSFNTRIFPQKNLLMNLRFNETCSIPSEDGDSRVCFDSSGNRYNGRIANYHWTMRQSGSLLPFDVPDPVLSIKAPAVRSLILEQQASGTAYDRSNDNIITRMLPEQFFQLEDFKNTHVLQDFLYILARQFDQTKQRIDQFVNVLKVDYGNLNQTPDALLAEVGKFFGWEFTGNFLNANTSQYLFGKGVLPNLETNKDLDVKLYEIKNEFWKRTLVNLMYIYKTKGTKESVEALFRVYGVNRNFIKLKEYGLKPAAGISTFRINSEKSVPAIAFGSGSTKTTNNILSKRMTSELKTIETRVRFPTTSSAGLTASLPSGTLWTLEIPGVSNVWMDFQKTGGYSSTTGSLTVYASSSSGLETFTPLTGAVIFDNEWYNVVFNDGEIDVRSRGGMIEKSYQTIANISLTDGVMTNFAIQVGSSGSTNQRFSECWMHEFRIWDRVLSETELEDHARNFQSFGRDNPLDGGPILHWRMNEDVTANGTGFIDSIHDFTINQNSGSAYGFTASGNPYKRFLIPYSFIAPADYGWNEDKVRVVPTTAITARDAFVDNHNVALEFNMVDALNEDISQIISSMDKFNNFIGLPVNRYRATYEDLDILRHDYFSRLQGNLNFRLFADMLEFFDRSFIEMVRKLIPARANFLGDEFVIESHMLERPKLQWNYRRQERAFQPEGRIKVLLRD